MSNIFTEEFQKKFREARENIESQMHWYSEFIRGPLTAPPDSELTFAAWLEKEGLPILSLIHI